MLSRLMDPRMEAIVNGLCGVVHRRMYNSFFQQTHGEVNVKIMNERETKGIKIA